MAKRSLDPSVRLFPAPTILVSCVDADGAPNIITVAWAGIVCSEPPTISVSIRPKQRHSYLVIKAANEYVVNIPTQRQLREADFCGMVSGSKVNKFKEAGFTPVPASQVRAPLIAECPVNIECVVKHRLALGTHDCFIGEVVAVHADEEVLDAKNHIDIAKVSPIAFCEGAYYSVGEQIGTYGFTRGKLGEE